MIVHAEDRIHLSCFLIEQVIRPRHIGKERVRCAKDSQDHLPCCEGRPRRRMHDPVAIATDVVPERPKPLSKSGFDDAVMDFEQIGRIDGMELAERNVLRIDAF